MGIIGENDPKMTLLSGVIFLKTAILSKQYLLTIFSPF